MNLSELASVAGVSVSTVSKALKNAPDIGDATKERIWQLAKEYGCYGKYYSSRFNKKVIAIILPEFAGNHYANIVGMLERLIYDSGAVAVCATDKFEKGRQTELIDYFISHIKVDGLFVFHLKEPLKKGYKNVPIVSFITAEDKAVDKVNVDMKAAMGEWVKYLYELGHRKIAFLGEGLTKGKGDNFLEAMKKYKGTCPYIFESSQRFEAAGEENAELLLSEAPECTALICAYDNIAYGAVKRLKEKGYSIPQDYSVIGCNNLSFSEYTDIPLASVDLNDDEVAKSAWELMQKKLDNTYYQALKPVVIHGSLVIKASIAPPRK
ncbi:MAG: LacI family DNA-binding transcriptional regulator [Clostridia bacterium]|nr:LacI family DNA-binding transcriptional regulator [Clostridia bacterium]